MSHTMSARKRVRQNRRRIELNIPFRIRASRDVKEAREAIEAGDSDATERIRDAQSALDRAARRNIIHQNTASRSKSRLVKS